MVVSPTLRTITCMLLEYPVVYLFARVCACGIFAVFFSICIYYVVYHYVHNIINAKILIKEHEADMGLDIS
jgi:hypothetical protein